MLVFSSSQLKNDSIGWRILDIALDNNLSAESSNFCPFCFFTGVCNNTESSRKMDLFSF